MSDAQRSIDEALVKRVLNIFTDQNMLRYVHLALLLIVKDAPERTKTVRDLEELASEIDQHLDRRDREIAPC